MVTAAKQKAKKASKSDQGHLVRSDLNLEKWNIFATQRNKGLRVLKREKQLPDGTKLSQQVTIGLKGSDETLTTEEGKLFYLFLNMWERGGRSKDGTVQSSLSRLLNDLIPGEEGAPKKTVRRGNWSKRWLRNKIKRMLTIPILYELAYENKDGTLRDYESFTLLKAANIYERKLARNNKQGYLSLSQFSLHPVIVNSILEKNIKPVRLDVYMRLKKEISLILYRYLDLIMSDKTQYERDVEELQQQLEFGPSRLDNLLRDLRESCAELEGKDLSTGRIEYCRVENRAHGNGWKLVVKKGKQVPQVEAKAIENDPEPDPDEQRVKALMALYETLPDAVKAKIESIQEEILKERYKGMGGAFTQRLALIDAIQQYKDQHSGSMN